MCQMTFALKDVRANEMKKERKAYRDWGMLTTFHLVGSMPAALVHTFICPHSSILKCGNSKQAKQ